MTTIPSPPNSPSLPTLLPSGSSLLQWLTTVGGAGVGYLALKGFVTPAWQGPLLAAVSLSASELVDFLASKGWIK